MRTKQLLVASVIVMALITANGVVVAQEELEMSDQQVCELEAEESGMMSEADISDYVRQCLEEVRLMNDDMDNNQNSHDNDSQTME